MLRSGGQDANDSSRHGIDNTVRNFIKLIKMLSLILQKHQAFLCPADWNFFTLKSVAFVRILIQFCKA